MSGGGVWRDATPEECQALIEEKGGGKCLILDVRTPAEYLKGHLPGAVNIDYYRSDFSEQVGRIGKDPTVIVYCRRGVRGAQALNVLTSHGFPRVFNMQGGFESWVRKGKPVSTKEENPTF